MLKLLYARDYYCFKKAPVQDASPLMYKGLHLAVKRVAKRSSIITTQRVGNIENLSKLVHNKRNYIPITSFIISRLRFRYL